MKHSSLKAAPARGGFVRTTLVPVWERGDLRFGLIDMTMIAALVFGTLFIARTFVGQ